MSMVLGIDTSCYTTSVALARDGALVDQRRKLLEVPLGGRGLQQSQGVFQHVGNLAPLLAQLMEAAGQPHLDAVCVSTRPRPVAGSYMPVFTVGEMLGRGIAAAQGLPLYETSHQQGHIRAAMVDAHLSPEPFLALHLSGGTTEVVLVRAGLEVELLGGSSDLHAGQFVDRAGVALGLPFPAGPALEQLALNGQAQALLPTAVQGLSVSFSGAESQVARWVASGALPPEQVAAEVFSCLARSIAKLLTEAIRKTGVHALLLAGGVASSALLRALLPERLARLKARASLHWARPELSGDNAAGVALIGCGLYKARLNEEEGQ